MSVIGRLLRTPAGLLGVALLLLVVGAAVSASFLYPDDPLRLAGRPLQWPGANPRFPLGTDNTGRDIAAQVLHGARVSLLIGVAATSLSLLIGVAVGALAGFHGGWVDDALMQPEPQAQYRRLLGQGWTDALRALHPDERIYTFWDYWRNAFARNAGIRIDHLLLNPAASARLAGAGVDRDVRAREGTSDHAPTWIELRDE